MPARGGGKGGEDSDSTLFLFPSAMADEDEFGGDAGCVRVCVCVCVCVGLSSNQGRWGTRRGARDSVPAVPPPSTGRSPLSPSPSSSFPFSLSFDAEYDEGPDEVRERQESRGERERAASK